MRKFFFTNVFILFLFVTGSITILYVFPERTQNFLMETLDLKSFFNSKLKIFIAKKINDKNINVNIDTIKFLKPDWPNIVKIELNNIETIMQVVTAPLYGLNAGQNLFYR